MIAINCFVADFNLVPGFSVISELTLNGRSIDGYLREASGNSGLDLTLDFSRRGRLPELVDPEGVRPDQMMDGLARLLGLGGTGGPVALGLLLTNSLPPPNDAQFGLMFDLDDQDGSLGPRQGCAVFLSAIAAALQNNDIDDPLAREFIAFTALHELGHAFNLWHLEGDSLMQPHPEPGKLGTLSFDTSQAHYLSLAGDPANARFVLPEAGSAPYGSRPANFPKGDADPFESPAPGESGLTLRVGLSNGSFWSFEPVELDVEISLPTGAAQPVLIPDEIDPGYASFQIWITAPDGTRSPFRASARYCSHNGRRELVPGQAYRRDISVTRQSHGYSFAAPGSYRIQAAFRGLDGRFIRSNVVGCEVKAPRPEAPEWRLAAAALDNFEAQRLFKYKRQVPSLSGYTRLVKFANEMASRETCATIHFAIGKTFLAPGQSAAAGEQSRLRTQGALHLGKAVATKVLGAFREGVANRLLEGLGDSRYFRTRGQD